MSMENNEITTPTSEQEEADLSAALASADTTFVTSEEKKPKSTQFLIFGGLLLLAPAIIWYMYNRGGPASAAAAALDQPPAAAQTVHTFLDSGQDGIRAMREMLKSTEKVVAEFMTYPSMSQIPLQDLRTNPFRMLGKTSDGSESAEKKKREEERAAVVKAVQGLQLQSIMSGKKGACVINNTLYTEGQQVDKFTVEKISNGTVVVKSGPYRFELKMQK
jgi:hypothetical protein